ncbi:tyrosine-type recombinase/integrase [Paraburkholderia sp. J10-1]|uniref:tyrosine-type recombinase/integrase n=1 Tax=Paraburkholderia sp. J10-1 TaxID=2805430 RepID=UPI002AB5EF1A|nr:tyrosine-type recombinase/integrase [Paraburkholderia sp. J10-1]
MEWTRELGAFAQRHKRDDSVAALDHFRFHAVRHTWASWRVQAVTPLPRRMELGGMAKYEMVLRYAHLAPHADAVTISARNGSGGPGVTR